MTLSKTCIYFISDVNLNFGTERVRAHHVCSEAYISEKSLSNDQLKVKWLRYMCARDVGQKVIYSFK